MTAACAENCAQIRQVESFLFAEAESLDTRDLWRWLQMLDPEIEYLVPTRSTREARSGSSPCCDESFYMQENFGSLRARINRFDSEHAWSENPPTLTRRFVTNVRVAPGAVDGQLAVKSNVMLSWTRDTTHRLLSAERHDILSRSHAGEPRLRKRLVLLDHITLPLPNLGFFL